MKAEDAIRAVENMIAVYAMDPHQYSALNTLIEHARKDDGMETEGENEHFLKTWPHSFNDIRDGHKKFDIRNETDRDVEVGDTMVFRKWCPNQEKYITPEGHYLHNPEAAETVRALVGYVVHGGRFELPVGVCVVGLQLLDT